MNWMGQIELIWLKVLAGVQANLCFEHYISYVEYFNYRADNFGMTLIAFIEIIIHYI